MPVVSVIMPAYNAERYLARAVESVLRQSFGDLELLIVDDGSSDRTVEVARGFAQRDARVRVLQQRTPGLARRAIPASAPRPAGCSRSSTATTSGTRRFWPSTSRSSTRGRTSTC